MKSFFYLNFHITILSQNWNFFAFLLKHISLLVSISCTVEESSYVFSCNVRYIIVPKFLVIQQKIICISYSQILVLRLFNPSGSEIEWRASTFSETETSYNGGQQVPRTEILFSQTFLDITLHVAHFNNAKHTTGVEFSLEFFAWNYSLEMQYSPFAKKLHPHFRANYAHSHQ
jgi:hypothetical protein